MAKAKKLERGDIRHTTFKLMQVSKLTPKSSLEAKKKVAGKVEKALHIEPGKALAVINFGLRERAIYNDVLKSAKKAGRSAARKGIKTKTKATKSKASAPAAAPAE